VLFFEKMCTFAIIIVFKTHENHDEKRGKRHHIEKRWRVVGVLNNYR